MIKTLIKIIVTSAFLGLVFINMDFRVLVNTVRETDCTYLAFGFGVSLLCIVLQGLRWYVILRSSGVPVRFGYLQLINFTAMFHDMYSPGRLGSDACRIIILKHLQESYKVAASLVALRVQGLSVVAALAIANILFFILDRPLLCWVFVFFVCASLFWAGKLIGLVQRWKWLDQGRNIENETGLWRHVRKTLSALSELRSRPVMIGTFILSLIFKMLNLWMFYLVGLSVGGALSFKSIFVFEPIMHLARMVPVSIQGRGVTEGLGIAFWANEFVSAESVVLICLLIYGFALVQGVVAGIVWAFFPTRKMLPRKKPGACGRGGERDIAV